MTRNDFEITSVTCEITLEFWPGFSDHQSREATIQDFVRYFTEMSNSVGIMDGADKYTRISRTVE